MTTCIVSLFLPVKTSVWHDEVSSLSINPVIELRERRRDVHTEEVEGLSRSALLLSLLPSLSHTQTHTTGSHCVLPGTHTHTTLPLYLLLHSICLSALFRCTSAEVSALALALVISLPVRGTMAQASAEKRLVMVSSQAFHNAASWVRQRPGATMS